MWATVRSQRVWRWSGMLTAAAALTVIACQDSKVPTGDQELSRSSLAGRSGGVRSDETAEAVIEVFAPETGHLAGINGIGWFVDLAVEFEGGDVAATGFTANQLTGPGVHENAPPMPGTFTPGRDDAFLSIVVLFTTNTLGAGGCQNLANLFNLTGPTNVAEDEVEIWDTWIITQPSFGVNTNSTMYVAIVGDSDGDGIRNDAPDVVPDANSDGRCNEKDLKALGLDSGVSETHFTIK